MKPKPVRDRGCHCAKCRRKLKPGELYVTDRGRLLASCCWDRASSKPR